MLILLLACTDPQTAGTTEFPTWSGTQIGEEGDEGCTMEGEVWLEEDLAPPGSEWTPAELRQAAGGTFTGTLSADWQGEEDITLTLTLDGPAMALNKSIYCTPALSVDGTLSLTSAELVQLESIAVTVQAESNARWLVSLSEDQLAGTLSPGTLPDDAGALSLLLVSGFIDGGWMGYMTWYLERPEGLEKAPAGSWSAD